MSNDSDSDDDDINDDDVCFGDETHPGTKAWREVVILVAKKSNDDEPYSPAIYRQIKKKMKDAKFYVQDSDGDWNESSKKELVKICGKAYDEAKKKKSNKKKVDNDVYEDFTETTTPFDDSLNEFPSSPSRSTTTTSSRKYSSSTSKGSPRSKRKPRTSSSSPGAVAAAAAAAVTATAVPLSPGGSSTRRKGGRNSNNRNSNNMNDEPMLKTVSMYFPPPNSGDLPEVTEKLIPLSSCNQETVAALTTTSATATATASNSTSSRVYGSSSAGMMNSSSGVVGISHSGTTLPTAYSSSSGTTGRSSSYIPLLSSDNSIYGRSIFQVPNSHNRLIAEAEFENFAPKQCICCQQCVGDQQRARTFARVYENRLEVNSPTAPWCCWTPEFCIVDEIQIHYFDNGPSQTFCGSKAELDCLAEICGQPVVFVHVPRMCCNLVDLRPCYGERIYAAPCTCCDLRWPWICVGRPCYEVCISCPFIFSLKNGKEFLAKYRGAVDEYAKIRPIKRHTQFHRVSEKPCGCDKVTVMDSFPVDHSMFQHAMKLKNIPAAIPNAFIMDRA